MTKIIGIILVISLCAVIFAACTSNESVRDYGGEMTITLPVNTKLTDVEWDEDDLWYMTRPMREDEIAETHIFQEGSSFGVMEGQITFVETKE